MRKSMWAGVAMAVLLVVPGYGVQGQSAAQGKLSPPAAPEVFGDENWKTVCAGELAAPLPPDAAAQDAAARRQGTGAAGGCDDLASYYGFERSPDYGAALRCAYLHRAHPKGEFMNGAGTLAMLYANGDGVPRSYSLAIRFVCELDESADAESELRVGRLEALRDGWLPAGTNFDLCDDQISGSMGDFCSELTEHKADVERARRIEVLRAKLPERARPMLPRLQAAERAFEAARTGGEYTGGGGSGSAAFEQDDENRLREQFVINLTRFGAGSVPRATAAERERAQQELDTAYRAVLAMPVEPDADSGSPTPEALKATEDAWQVLFRAWMEFVPVAYPNLSPDAAATQLLRLRIHQLKRVAG